jgi:hypothetical protein
MEALSQGAITFLNDLSAQLRDRLGTNLGTVLGDIAQALAVGPLPSGSGCGNGAKNGAAVAATEYGNGVVHKTVLTLTSAQVTVANTTDASFGGLKLYDFPEGRLLVLGCTADLDFDWAGEDISATGSGDFALGTTITADATLSGTDADLLPSTAMTDPFVAGVGEGKGALAASAQFDGTTTAKDANINIIIDDAAVANGASDVVSVTGTITIVWVNLGDY